MAGRAIFINYRKEDAPDAVERIHDRLVHEFRAAAVFKDTAALQAGQKWEQAISETLAECRVVLAIIGPNWLGILRERERTASSSDYVRLELEWAHTAGVQVVPVLVNFPDDKGMPASADLPASLQFLTHHQAARVRRHDFHEDMNRLVDALKKGGHVQVETPTTPMQDLWAKLRVGFDHRALRNFADTYPNTSESFQARERADRVEVAHNHLNSSVQQATSSYQGFIASPFRDSVASTISYLEQLLNGLPNTEYVPPSDLENGRKQISDMIQDLRSAHDKLLHAEQKQAQRAQAEKRRQADDAAAAAHRQREAERSAEDARAGNAVLNVFHILAAIPASFLVFLLTPSWIDWGSGGMPLLAFFVWLFALGFLLGASEWDWGRSRPLRLIVCLAIDVLGVFYLVSSTDVLSGIASASSSTVAAGQVDERAEDNGRRGENTTVSAPSAPSTSKEEFNILGSWTGTVDQNGEASYPVEVMVVSATADGEFAARVHYPHTSCSARWTHLAVTADMWSVVEYEASNDGACAPNPYIDLVPREDGSVFVRYMRQPNSAPTAVAILQRS
jgi:hypothetical protein